MSKPAKTILVISDTHAPYMHVDAADFLQAIKETYKPDRIVHIGDEVDKHDMSFHTSDPNLSNAKDELAQAITQLQPLYKMFPKVDVLHSNHGSLAFRKAMANGIPDNYIRPYGEVLEAPKGWKWHEELVINTGGQDIVFRHQFTKKILLNGQMIARSVVSGHFHENFQIEYASSPDRLIWAMMVGCLIDKDSRAFAYNKTNVKRPIIGCGLVIDGHPMLVPMVLSKTGRWIQKLV